MKYPLISLALLTACGGQGAPVSSQGMPFVTNQSAKMRVAFNWDARKLPHTAPPSGPGCLELQDEYTYTSPTSNSAILTPHYVAYPGELIQVGVSYNSHFGTPTMPGFTLLATALQGNDAISEFYKIATATEPSSYRVSLSGTASDTLNVQAYVFSDENQAQPFSYVKSAGDPPPNLNIPATPNNSHWSSIGVAMVTTNSGPVTNVPGSYNGFHLDDYLSTQWHPLSSFTDGYYLSNTGLTGTINSNASGILTVVNPAHPLPYGGTPCVSS